MNSLALQTRRAVGWMIRRNPTYLMSAVLMVIGARLFLVSGGNATGDVRLILYTLAILQAYEWAVGAILIALDRARKSPEDEPSLLLISAAFWTGPIAATLEMIALLPALGAYLAAGACLIAIGEMRLYCRALRLSLSGPAQGVGIACLLLLTIAAPLLKMPDSASGANELHLYAAWWVFGAIVLACSLATWRSGAKSETSTSTRSSRFLAQDAAFLAITITATAVHLVGMNYGFFCHAKPFYGSPVIVALSVVGFETLARTAKHRGWVLATIAVLPLVAILLATQSFDENVPLQRLPNWLRDPVAAMSRLAAAGWCWGFARHRRIVLLHAASVAGALAAFRLIKAPGPGVHQMGLIATPSMMYTATAYLLFIALIRRSRFDAICRLCANLAATVVTVHHRSPADTLIICLAIGWTPLIAIHLSTPRPGLLARAIPIAFLLIIPWTLDSAPLFKPYIAEHSAALILALFVVGHIWQWTAYRSIALAAASAHAAAIAWVLVSRSSQPAAIALVSAGFTLLAAGAFLSWNKLRVLGLVCVPDAVVRDDTMGSRLLPAEHPRSGP